MLWRFNGTLITDFNGICERSHRVQEEHSSLFAPRCGSSGPLYGLPAPLHAHPPAREASPAPGLRRRVCSEAGNGRGLLHTGKAKKFPQMPAQHFQRLFWGRDHPTTCPDSLPLLQGLSAPRKSKMIPQGSHCDPQHPQLGNLLASSRTTPLHVLFCCQCWMELTAGPRNGPVHHTPHAPFTA